MDEKDQKTLDDLDAAIEHGERAREARSKFLASLAVAQAATADDYFKLPVEERQKLTESNPEYVMAMWKQKASEAEQALRKASGN